jgi:hypothetical protein
METTQEASAVCRRMTTTTIQARDARRTAYAAVHVQPRRASTTPYVQPP